ncbi:MAG: divergent PAP2 family protein [candidate division SR1 bacterium]|nr:divergent PAP2 family protein [candidate division SR1 bacterium]
MIQYAIDAFRDYFAQGFQMSPIFIVITVGCIIQIVKVIIDLIRYKRFYIGHIFASGGFPSFHSGLASSVTMLVRLEYGFGSVLFAVAFAFSVLFAYDAMNLRYETGQHAHYINDLRLELQAILQKKEKGILKERIGHTPLEVAGGILFGSILTYVFYYIYFIG